MNKRLNKEQQELLTEMDAFLADLIPGTRAVTTIYLTIEKYKIWQDICRRAKERSGHYIHIDVDANSNQYKGFDIKKIGIQRKIKYCAECNRQHDGSLAICDECNDNLMREAVS